MASNLNFYKKYLKYKIKYLELAKLMGGALPKLHYEGSTNSEKYYTNNLDSFLKLVSQYDGNDLTMMIGMNIENDADRVRNVNIDVGWDGEIKKDSLNQLSESDIKWFQIDADINTSILSYMQDLEENGRKYNGQKFKLLQFDHSVTKFLGTSDFIVFLYYFLLQPGGALYFDFFLNMMSPVPEKSPPEIDDQLPPSKLLLNGDFFIGCNGIVKLYSESKYNIAYTRKEIMENNKKYLERKLNGSVITLHNDNDYPNKHPQIINRPVLYYKIIKANESIISNNILPLRSCYLEFFTKEKIGFSNPYKIKDT